jgi:N-acetyl-anhydromuramyl-L-alanine amidase AmpD/peptidoglycan hydrolase-like protein with peptidoglycan-binding domain
MTRLPELQAKFVESMRTPHLVEIFWVPIDASAGGHSARIWVSSDAITLNRDDLQSPTFRVSWTAHHAQLACDALGAQALEDISQPRASNYGWARDNHVRENGILLPTMHICDLVFEQASKRARPQTLWSLVSDIADESAMLLHSSRIGQHCGALLSNIGKHWVLSNQITTSRVVNYGWFDQAAPYVGPTGKRMWQTPGTKHGPSHVDYSQTLRAVLGTMEVDGEPMALREVASSPELHQLVMGKEGPLRIFRIPGTGGPARVTETAPPFSSRAPALDAPLEVITHVLRKGSPYREEVKAWQHFLDVASDGDFRTITHNATRAFQLQHGLVADGVVGPVTLGVARGVREDTRRAVNPASFDVGPVIAIAAGQVTSKVTARNFGAAGNKYTDRSKDIRHIVIHTAEMAEKPTGAEALGAWVSGPSAPQASWHYAVDNDSVVQCLDDKYIAWHAPGANRSGIGIEHVGYAKQGPAEWEDDFSVAQLQLSAQLTATLCQKWGIPARFVDAEGLKRGEAGITTHDAVSRAFKKSTHYDPGNHFPMELYMRMVRHFLPDRTDPRGDLGDA